MLVWSSVALLGLGVELRFKLGDEVLDQDGESCRIRSIDHEDLDKPYDCVYANGEAHWWKESTLSPRSTQAQAMRLSLDYSAAPVADAPKTDVVIDQPLSAAASSDPEPPQSASPKLFEATHGTVAACLVLVAVLLAVSLLTIRRKPNSSKRVDPEPSRSPPSPGPETDGTATRSQSDPARASPASPDPPQRCFSASELGGISPGPQEDDSLKKLTRYKRITERIIESLVFHENVDLTRGLGRTAAGGRREC